MKGLTTIPVLSFDFCCGDRLILFTPKRSVEYIIHTHNDYTIWYTHHHDIKTITITKPV